jgi:2,4-dienoyl-CoA reductase-like NADH-dependent reductase (Old Yellow Enzyme family)/thioredoxin reductase
MTEYSKIFSPIKINQMMVPNRLMAAPGNGGYSKERATTGAAINIWGCGTVNLKNAGMVGEVPYMFSKYQYQKTRRILDFMKQGGAKASLEIMHAGLMRRGEDNVGPVDGINCEGIPYRELRVEELQEIATAFGQMAKDAKQFGFDMVMLHFAHGWLPAEFLSPAWNKRTDEYGGCYENRARFPLMILQAVRNAVGKDYPVDMRISVKEWVDGEIAFEDVLRFIQDAEPYIDMVNLSAGTDMDKNGCVHMTTSALEPRLTNVEYAKIVKSKVHIPVAVVGSIFTPEEAERLVENGYADLIMLGRALIADPFWIKKTREKKEDDIVPCIRCGYCSHWASGRYNHGCSVNPRYLRDDWVSYEFQKDESPRNFVIIGGGIAGMRAAITAAARGEKVTLLEQNNELGGVLRFVDQGNYKNDLKRYKDYLIGQVKKSDVQVSLGTKATPQLVKALNPDVLILAIGAKSVKPRMPGVDKCMPAIDAYYHFDEIGKQVVIIGGGVIGCELALELDNGERQITIIESTDRIHHQDNMMLDIALDQHLSKASHIQICTNTRCEEVKADRVVLSDGKEIPFDQVILSIGMKADIEQVNQFYGITSQTYTIGDCVKSAKIKEANDAAYFTALNV